MHIAKAVAVPDGVDYMGFTCNYVWITCGLHVDYARHCVDLAAGVTVAHLGLPGFISLHSFVLVQ